MIAKNRSAGLGDLIRILSFERERPFLDVVGARTLNEHFRRIKHNYKIHQEGVDLGLLSWDEDPYEIADWLMLFTPIEAAAWSDIRAAGLPLWPQLPVGRFFVDFGNPVKRVALECDGKAWHNPAKDARRDAVLLEMGWTVYRAPGWRCLAGDDELRQNTMKPIIKQISEHFA